jgi:hypothetical protein
MVHVDSFRYSAVVPEGPKSTERRMVASPLPSEFASYPEGEVLGTAPVIETVEDTSVDADPVCKVLISASRPAKIASASFSVDRELIRMLRPGDVVNIVRSYRRDPGFSVVRDGELVVGVGAVADVPLGSHVTVDYAGDLVSEAERIFKAVDPEYRASQWPLAVTVAGFKRLLNLTIATIGEYDIYIARLFNGVSGALASISRTGVAPDCAGSTTAALMKREEMRLTGWNGERHVG